MIGRGTGVVEGTIWQTDDDGDYVTDLPASDPRNLGAPVFTKDGKLAGMLMGSVGDMAWVMPIGDVLNGLDVKLDLP